MAASVDASLRAFLPSEIVLEGLAGDDPLRALDAPTVAPRSVEELAEAMSVASREGWRVLPVGAATSLPPEAHGTHDLVVTTRAMAAIRQYEPADLTVTADAGITLGSLDVATREAGQWLPLDPPRRPARTLGGLLATGAWGPLHAGFGSPRDHVLGLTLVTGDGRVLELGGQVVKNVAGYDLVKLAVGSRGRLGVVASATVRLHPVPERDVTALFGAPSVGVAIELARALAQAPVQIAALELQAPRCGPVPADADVVVAVRALGSPDAVGETIEILGMAAGRPPDAQLEDHDSSGWFHELECIEDDVTTVVRVAHRPSRLPSLVEACRDVGRIVVHVAAGVIRVLISEGDSEDLAQRLSSLRDRVVEADGSFRVMKVADVPWPRPEPAAGAAVQELVGGIVGAFDPAGVLSDPS